MAKRSHLFPCRTQKLSSLAPMVVGLTFRKSRTLPGSIIGCDEPRPRGLFFFVRKELNFFGSNCLEKAFEADELNERRNELTSGKWVRRAYKWEKMRALVSWQERSLAPKVADLRSARVGKVEYMSKSSCISPTNTMKHNLIIDLRVYLNKLRS